MKDLTPRKEDLDPIEIASRDEISAVQLSRLKRAVTNAYENVPHYKAKFDAAGVHPDDLKTLGDLAKFPFTVKSDLRDNYPFGMFAVPRDQVVRVHASSLENRARTGPIECSRMRIRASRRWRRGG